MGFGTKGAKAKPSYTGIQLQTSSSVLPVALVFGKTRIAPNLWWYGDFQSHKQKVKTGKGFGGSATTFTYSASVIAGLCCGEISGVGRAWKDQGEEADFASFGFTLFTGAVPQAPWGYLTASHPDQADSYPGGAYLAKANLDLGASASLGNFSFEPLAILYNTQVDGAGDADPAQVVDLVLTDPRRGAGFPAALLDYDALLSGPDATTTGDSAHQTYCRAMGFGISPAMVEQEPAAEALERWCKITNTAPVWTGASLKLVPYGDEEVTGHGVTYLPPTAARYDLGDDDFQQSGDADPVKASRSDPADAKNLVNFIIRDRGNAYNELPVPYKDDNAIALFGERPAEAVSAREVCEPEMAGRMVALYGQRILYNRNRYEFSLDPRYDRLEPMDVVRLTDDKLGLRLGAVRLEEIDEDENDQLACLAVLFPGTLGAPGAAATGTGATPTNVNSLSPPGPVNPPLIFEPSSALAQRLFGSASACIVAAVSGGDGTTAGEFWGGAVVWVSTDNATYQPIGEVEAAARMGVTTAALAAYGGVNPDTVNTLGVDLAMSDGDLTGVSSGDAEAGATLCVIQDAGGAVEVLGFRDATLTGPDAYDLDGEIFRGLYGTAPAAHLTAVAFARLDGNVFRADEPAAYIGVPLWFKFQSFNIWGDALEDLATCTAYPYTPTGVGFGSGAAGVPQVPTGLVATPGVQAAVLAWAANASEDNVTGYRVWRADGLAAVIADAVVVATVTALTWTDLGLGVGADYSYFLTALNAAGESAATAAEDLTTSGTALGGGSVVATYAVTASEDLAAGDLVNLHTVGGALRMRRADADDTGKPAHGFVKAITLTGAAGTFYGPGQINDALAGLTPGADCWLATVAGGVQTAAPATTLNGNQPVGQALSATELLFNPLTMTEAP